MTTSYADLFREARAAVREVTPRQADALRSDPATLFVDIREADEWEQGHIPGAVLVPRSHLEQEIETKAADRARPLVLYCAGGVRSVFVARTLQEMGYATVVSMSGGFAEWTALGLPSVRPAGLTTEQKRRLLPILREAFERRQQLLAIQAEIIRLEQKLPPMALEASRQLTPQQKRQIAQSRDAVSLEQFENPYWQTLLAELERL